MREKAKQALMLYGSLMLSMGLSLVASMITTRYLNPDEFGNLKFLATIWYLFNISISFGFFHSAGQALLINQETETGREIIGADLLVAFLMGLLICTISITLAKPIEILFNIQIARSLRIVAPLLIFFPMKDSLTLIYQCTNKIKLLSLLNIVPPFIFILFLIFLPRIMTPNIISIIYAQQIGTVIIIFSMVILSKPSFNNLKKSLMTILHYQKTYGTPVYIAVICSVVTQQINRLGIVYWVDSASIGYYSLASQLVDPLRLIPSSVATSSFRDFSFQKRISKKVLWATSISILGGFLLVLFALGKPLAWVYPKAYAENISRIGIVLAFNAIVIGFAELFNRFLGAHGRGKDLRNTAVIVGIFNILGFVLFTPLFGLWGTIASASLGNMSFLLLMFLFYKKFMNSYSLSQDSIKGNT